MKHVVALHWVDDEVEASHFAVELDAFSVYSKDMKSVNATVTLHQLAEGDIQLIPGEVIQASLFRRLDASDHGVIGQVCVKFSRLKHCLDDGVVLVDFLGLRHEPICSAFFPGLGRPGQTLYSERSK